MRFSIVLGVLASLMLSAVASAYDDPRSLVDAIYQPYLAGRQQQDLNQFYSARLRQLFLDQAETAAHSANTTGSISIDPVVGFNPFLDADHGLIIDVTIGEPVIVGNKALVAVGFHNFDQPTLLTLALVREDDGWKVDDVVSTGGEDNWMLSWLLKYDPWGM